MRLPRVLTALAGPSTPATQQTFLRDLKQAFRDRVEHRAPPLESSINRHLERVLLGPKKQTLHHDAFVHLAPGLAARELYIQGRLTRTHLHELLNRSTSRLDLDAIKAYALKAGIDIVRRPTDLSARFAAKLLHLGYIDEVKVMIEKETTEWISTQSAHPLLLQYASRSLGGIAQARTTFDHLVEIDARNKTIPLIRCLLRESVRRDSKENALYCLRMSREAAKGQETGLARWLSQRSEYGMAFDILKLAEPSRIKEGKVGLEIARGFMEVGAYAEAGKVMRWVESRYILSLQPLLKQLEAEMERHSVDKTPHASAASASAAAASAAVE